MPELKLDRLSIIVAQKFRPFIEEILNIYSENIHSIYIVGSAVTEDYNKDTSDINSIFVLHKMDLKFIELLAPLGKKYKKKGIAAPLIMTPEYISNSLDVFPIEFLNFKFIHDTVYGDDILNDIEISKADLRYQCERELKSKLIGLRQGYIFSEGDKKIITGQFAASIPGYMPLFRGIIFLMGKEIPIRNQEVISSLSSSTGINTNVFQKILDMKRGKLKLNKGEIESIFEDYYEATEKIGEIIDEYKI